MCLRNLGRACAAFAALAAPAVSCATSAQALEPGVHVDPGSPAAKEYVLPLSQARQTGSESSTQASPEGTLFGTGIKPPGSGKPPGARTGGAGAKHGAGLSASTAPASSGSGSGSAIAPPIFRQTPSQGSGSGDGSILALVGGGIAILVLGGFGGTVLRHSRRPPTPPSSA